MRSYLPIADPLRRLAAPPLAAMSIARAVPVSARLNVGIAPWLVPLIAVPVAFLLLAIRRPETLTRAEFWSDDGLFYQLGLDAGLRSLTIPYAGTLVLVQRMIVMVETAVPPAMAPVIGNAAAILMTALVAGFIASSRLSQFIPSPAWRAGAALAFVMLPATGWLYWTLADVQWITGTYLLAMLVATPPTSARGRFGDAIGVLLAGLTGPLSILLLPLYIVRAIRAPVWRWHVLWLGSAAALQSLALLTSYRAPGAGLDLAALPEVFALRAVVIPLAGVNVLAVAALPVGSILLLALAAAVRRLPLALVGGAAYVAVLIPLAGMQTTQFATASLMDPHRGEQYFYLGAVVLAGLTVAALARGYRSAVPIALVLSFSVIVGARVSAIPAVGWADRAACIGGPVACVVPVAPDAHWSVSWKPETR